MSRSRQDLRYSRKDPVRSDTPGCTQMLVTNDWGALYNGCDNTTHTNDFINCIFHQACLQESLCQEVCTSACQLPLEVPAKHATPLTIACAGNDVAACLQHNIMYSCYLWLLCKNCHPPPHFVHNNHLVSLWCGPLKVNVDQEVGSSITCKQVSLAEGGCQTVPEACTLLWTL